MGMSSSQARLLHLTARMHQIEYKAAKVEAQKLQMANESRRVYDDYLRVLDARKIQYQAINSDGSIIFKDADMNSFQNGLVHDTSIWNGETASKSLFLQKQDGTILVTPAIAQKYGLSNTKITEPMDDYIHRITNEVKSSRQVKTGQHWESTGVVSGITSISNSLTAPGSITAIENHVEAPTPTGSGVYSYNPVENTVITTKDNEINYRTFQNPIEKVDTSSMTSIQDALSINSDEYVISSAEDLLYLKQISKTVWNGEGKTIYLSSDINMDGKDWDGIGDITHVFNGNINGNGYVIKNLGQNATAIQGLICVSESISVVNLGLENINIVNNADCHVGRDIGGIIGEIANGNGACQINNCFLNGYIEAAERSVGGLVGYLDSLGSRCAHLIVDSCNADVDIVMNDPLRGVAWGAGQIIGYVFNKQSACLGILNSNVAGTITDYRNDYTLDSGEVDKPQIGGLVGSWTYSGLHGAVFENCVITTELIDGLNDGHKGGIISGSPNGVAISEDYFGLGLDLVTSELDSDCVNNIRTDFSINDDGTGGLNSTYSDYEDTYITLLPLDSIGINKVITPSYEGLKSNTYAALFKYYNGNISDIDVNALNSYCQKMFSYATPYNDIRGSLASDIFQSKENWLKSANINEYLCQYLNDDGTNGADTTDGAFIQALVNDINNNATSETTATEFQNIYDNSYNITKSSNYDAWTPEEIGGATAGDGEVSVPTQEDIADVLYYHFLDNGYTVDQTDVRNWVNTKYDASTTNGMYQLAMLTDAIKAGKFSDIYAKYSATPQEAYIGTTTQYNTTDYNFSFKPDETIVGGRGLVKLPTVEDISDMLYYNLVKNGKFAIDDATYTKDYIRTWVNNNFTTSGSTSQAQMAILADVNTAIQGGNAVNIFDNVASYTSATPTYSTTDYDFEFLADQNVTATQGGGYVDDYTTEYYWDVTNPAIAAAMAAWLLGQKGIEVITSEQASNSEYVVNMLNTNAAVLTTFDPTSVAALVTMSDAEKAALTDSDYDKLLGIENTSVAVDTSVREVDDEKELRKAEAKYEADMRKIDHKDRRYDTELAALDAERNAIKSEMDTLKNVVKDNVERTFKLFS